MLTTSRDDQDLFESVLAGAAGYLLKDTNPDRLPFALRGVLRGEAALPRTLMARVLEEFRARDARRRPSVFGGRQVSLTDREWEVLDRLRAGASTRDVAGSLGISEVTVRRHISSLLGKLGVADRQAAIDLADAEEPPSARS